MKAIDVNGFRYCDIVLYLANLLTALGEKVFVRDLSEDGVMYKYLPKVERVSSDDILELKGVSFVQGYKLAPEDCTFCFNLWEPQMNMSTGYVHETDHSDYKLFVTDEEPAHQNDMDYSVRFTARSTGDYVGHDSVFVLRDYMGMTMKNLVESFKNSGHNRILRLPYSAKDRKAELYLTVRDDISFLTVSEKMACLLEELILKFRPQTTGRDFERAYREVMRGGTR